MRRRHKESLDAKLQSVTMGSRLAPHCVCERTFNQRPGWLETLAFQQEAHMITTVFVVTLGVLAVYFGFRAVNAFRTYFKLRSPRLLTCPETKQVVLVEVAAQAAAL